jgi:L,D-transpeptidase YcbB
MRPGGDNCFRQTWRRMLRSTCAISAIIAAIGVTSAQSAPTYWRDLRTTQARPSEAQAALQDILQSRGASSFASMFSETLRAQLISFYANRQFRPAWSGGVVEQDRAAEAVAVLARAEDQGLRSEDYLSPDIEWTSHPRRGGEAARYDIALTAAVLRYAHDLSVGRTRPNAVYSDVKLPSPNFDSVDALIRMHRGRSIAASLADLAPRHPQYRRLAEAMTRYRAIEAEGGWPSLPARGEVGLDGNDRRTKALIQRLASEDEALASISEPSSDDVRDAVMRFQSRNGLEADGRVTGATLTALNIPVSRRIEVLAANMERWRWLPRTFESRYIEVNVPDQSVTFVRNGDTVLSSRVVVGRKNSRTPILRADAVALIVNPPWEIPGDIVVNQMLPKLRRSSGYLQASNMVLVNAPNDPFGRKVNWRNISPNAFPFRVVQLPGPSNALGNIMIDTPNDYDVYLHDTPSKALFKSADRAVSNGCIRVEAIFQLASLALDESDAETELTQLIGARETKRVPLERPMPVYFLYWTAIAAPDGGVGFRGDLYGRDTRLIAALAEPVIESRELASVEPNAPSAAFGSARVSDTLLPATSEPRSDTERVSEPSPPDEYGSELPPLDERGAEIPPLADPGADDAPPQTESTTQRDAVADAVRRANDRTRFTDEGGRADSTRPAEPTGLRRSWPDDSARYGRSRRLTQSEPAFPLLRRLFDGNRSREPYTRPREP